MKIKCVNCGKQSREFDITKTNPSQINGWGFGWNGVYCAKCKKTYDMAAR